MKIAIIGAGAIGSLLGGLLAKAGEDVTLIGHQPHVDIVNKNGLVIDGVPGNITVRVRAAEKLEFQPDLAVLAVKVPDITTTLQQYASQLKQTTVVTIQNGVRADELTAQIIARENVVSCVLLLGATFLEPGKITYAVEGKIIVGEPFKRQITNRVERIARTFSQAIETHVTSNVYGLHWTKLIINENNALPAITGKTIQEVNAEPYLRKLSLLLMREAVDTLNDANIKTASLPGLPAGLFHILVHLPWPLEGLLPRLITRAMGKIPALGSTLQSIKKGEKTEIDYLNGEVITLGQKIHKPTPYNSAVVAMVHQVEQTGEYLSIDFIRDNINQHIS